MPFEIIDFHTHPFTDDAHNICAHRRYCDMSIDNTRTLMERLGVSRICGSVIGGQKTGWERIKENNDLALQLREHYKGFYVPGFHIHPDYPEQSLEEIRRMAAAGVRLIGELVPYKDGTYSYGDERLSPLLEEAGRRGMVVSFHSMDEDGMDKMVKRHPQVTFVAAHPGELSSFMRHMERMKTHENCYLDVSGTGIFRYGLLQHAIAEVGADRILFGSDYPTCNPAMFVGAVLLDNQIRDEDKEKILAGNAKRLLGL